MQARWQNTQALFGTEAHIMLPQQTGLLRSEANSWMHVQDVQPGLEFDMKVKPIFIRESYKGADKLKGKVAIITGVSA
jgi:hypothetical protein